jgi:hypothetical protein
MEPAMRLGVSLALLILADAALARPSTLHMTCNEAAELVGARGAVVLSTGRYTYDRFVASPGFCMLGEYGRPAWAPTRDTDTCPLGYVCAPGKPPWEEDFFED